jgi:hypothetical protein
MHKDEKRSREMEERLFDLDAKEIERLEAEAREYLKYEDGAEDGTVVISGYQGDGGLVYIPSFLHGKKVDSINFGAFRGKKEITSVIISDGVRLGHYAFAECDHLTSVVLPKDLKEVPKEAFYFCKNLVSVTLPDTVKRIDDCAFSACAFEEITLPEGLQAIGHRAFQVCPSLKSITIPESVVKIGSEAFLACDGLESVEILTKNINLEIGARAFARCKSLVHIGLPKDFPSIGKGMFQMCHALTEVTLPDGLRDIYAYAFGSCENLLTMHFSPDLWHIEKTAFYGCKKLIVHTCKAVVKRCGKMWKPRLFTKIVYTK